MSEQRIGKYVIQGEIGRGAMGVVYKAVDPVIGRTVAIKTVRFDLLTDPGQQDEAQRRFEREAQSAGCLSHPNIVTIYDVGESGGMTFIAMEYVEGESLESLLAAGVRWDAPGAARFAVQMAEGLDLAHRKGIVHRDIKPANILVDSEGRPHIVDFGIARISSSTMTQTHMVMGTPYYMSPEQVAGRKVDHRADIFALGAVLYEMLTREKPFPGDTLTTVIYKIMNETPVPVRKIRGDIPEGISRIIAKALEKDPDSRYGNCRELIAALRPFLAEVPDRTAAAPVVSYPPAVETIEVAVPAKTRLKRPMEPPAAPPAEGPSPGEAQRRKSMLLVVGLMMALVVVIGGVLYVSSLKPKEAVVPPGGAFSVDISEKAVPESPVGTEASPAAASEPSAATTVAIPETKADPPKTAAEEGAQDFVFLGEKAGAVQKETTPPPAGKGEDLGFPSVAKDGSVGKGADSTKTATRLPRLLRQVDPVYPPEALRDRISGDVTLNLTVGFTGKVERAAVVKSVPKLDAAAVAAARQWEFEPGLYEGIPIQATLQVTIHFSLPPADSGKNEPPPAEKAKTAEIPPPSEPQDDLSRASGLLERGFYKEALAAARTFLASSPNSLQAKSVALDAVIRLAPAEIKALVDESAASYKTGEPAEFFRVHARSDIYSRLRGDLEMLMNTYRDIQVNVSGLNLDFQMARYPDFQTRAVFSQVMTGIPASKMYREVMFEGRYSWILERRENVWVIVAVKVD